MNGKKRENYRSWIIVAWEEPQPDAKDGAQWRYRVEKLADGTHYLFSDAEKLLRFFKKHLVE
jgi:hypothetical protein